MKRVRRGICAHAMESRQEFPVYNGVIKSKRNLNDVNSIEHTIGIIKPEGMKHAKQIIATATKKGFTVLKKRVVHLTPEQASELYAEHYGESTFPLLVASTSSAPIMVLCLGKVNAIEDWKTLVGPSDIELAKKKFPNTFNALFGNASGNCNFSPVYASNCKEAAAKEIQFFFPEAMSEPMHTIQNNLDYLNEHVNPLLREGLAQVCKYKPAEPLLWLANWLMENNPNRPQMPSYLQ